MIVCFSKLHLNLLHLTTCLIVSGHDGKLGLDWSSRGIPSLSKQCRVESPKEGFLHTPITLNTFQFKVVGPKWSTNRNLKEIIAINCTETDIFQLVQPLGISKLAKRELIQ